jgi:hypothetical protein
MAVAGLGGALLVGRGGDDSAVPSGPTTTTAPRLTTAAEMLIATAVRQETNEKVSGKYFRVRSLQLNGTRRTITESWMPMKPGVESWFGWVNLGDKDPAPVVNKMSFDEVPPGYFLTGDRPLSAQQIAALPTHPGALRTALTPLDVEPAYRDFAVFGAAGRLLFETPSPPKLRGTALRVLASLPGTHVRQGVKDPLGRVGTEVSITATKPGSASTTLGGTGQTYIIDPATGRLLSSTITGRKSAATVVLESGWTDHKPVPPSAAVK